MSCVAEAGDGNQGPFALSESQGGRHDEEEDRFHVSQKQYNDSPVRSRTFTEYGKDLQPQGITLIA